MGLDLYHCDAFIRLERVKILTTKLSFTCYKLCFISLTIYIFNLFKIFWDTSILYFINLLIFVDRQNIIVNISQIMQV